MKKSVLITAIMFFASFGMYAQKTVPMVDSKGHIINHDAIIGKMTPKGSFDPKGKFMTKVNENGNIVDSDGKVLGKAPKNGTFIYYFNDKEEKYNIGKADHTGKCKVTNEKGETVMLLHNNYKQQAACAIHCLHENHCLPGDKKEDHKH